MQTKQVVFSSFLLLIAGACHQASAASVELGPRPYYLLDKMQDGPLKDKLMECAKQDKPQQRSTFSISHRGAPLFFPEHTYESYRAAERMGAGIMECDVAFTQDKQLVCRHAQNDLHTTTNILTTPLAAKCSQPFVPAHGEKPAKAECRTSDITLAEFNSLQGKMDGFNPQATTAEAYQHGTPGWRTDLYAAEGGKLMTHAESIKLFKSFGVKFTPELKTPVVDMPFHGLTQQAYAQMLVDDYKQAGIPAKDVYLQSFNIADVLYWIAHEPEFGKQAIMLDGRETSMGFDPNDAATFQPSMQQLAEMGIRYIGPPLWMLVTVKDGQLAPSVYAEEANKAGLKIIAWSLERSGPLVAGGGWYYQSVAPIIHSDAMVYPLLDVLSQQIGVAGIFADWPATVTFYANCMGLN